jgi:arylsulfatase A-like enzyme
MTRAAKVNQVIWIIMDDVRASHLFELIDKGKLPHISELAANGISCQECITSFPSVTFPCYPNIVTGAYSGYYPKEGSGIPSYHWIARNEPLSVGKKLPYMRNYDERSHLWKIGKDLGKNCLTIFEQAGEGNYLSATNVVFRGSHFTVPSNYNSQMIFKTAEEAFEKPTQFFSSNEVPKITIIYAPITDELMHEKGFDHPEYINEILNYDLYIGSLIAKLKNLGYYKDTAICIISDHGNYKAKNVHDIASYFENLGLRQYMPKKNTGDFDANMGSVGFFNFRGDTWHHHPTLDQLKNFNPSGTGSNNLNLFNSLWKIPGVKYMYYRDDDNTPDKGTIHIEKRLEKNGKSLKGRIEYEGHGKSQKTKYVYEEEEFFGYGTHEEVSKLIGNGSHIIDEWVAATCKIDFPMFIDQLPRYFKNPRSCDIMISTCGEYAFNYEHGKTSNDHRYSHDIALKNSMTVPFIIGGSPEIPRLKLEYCKTTDMVPTLLDLLGTKPHSSVVGNSLLP